MLSPGIPNRDEDLPEEGFGLSGIVLLVFLAGCVVYLVAHVIVWTMP